MATQIARIQWRRDVATDLAADNPTLAAGEAAMETDTGRWKLGPGAWNTLPYQNGTTAAQVPFVPAGTIAATDVQAAIVEVAAEAGSGGAVASVNGQTGVVSLDATDVGADTAGSAAAVQANLDGHEALLGSGTHVPTGGLENDVLTKGAGTSVAWSAPAAGGVSSVNGETGAVSLSAADVGADTAGSAAAVQGNLTAHAGTVGSSGHLAAGGTPGQVPVSDGAGASPWATLAAAQVAYTPTAEIIATTVQAAVTEVFGNMLAVLEYNTITGEYDVLVGAGPVSALLRWWRGPVLPKDASGANAAAWQPGDFYTSTATP